MTSVKFMAALYLTPLLFLLLLVVDSRVGLEKLPARAYDTVIQAVPEIPDWPGDGSEPDTPGSAREMVVCDTCGQGPMEAEDLPEHRAAQHEEDDDDLQIRSSRDDGTVSRGDLVDDYDPDWADAEANDGPEVDIQDPSGGGRDPLGNYRPYYQRITEEIEERGSFTVTDQTHVGSVRGFHVVQEFRSAVRRHPEDSLDDYEFDDGGGCPVEIRREP